MYTNECYTDKYLVVYGVHLFARNLRSSLWYHRFEFVFVLVGRSYYSNVGGVKCVLLLWAVIKEPFAAFQISSMIITWPLFIAGCPMEDYVCPRARDMLTSTATCYLNYHIFNAYNIQGLIITKKHFAIVAGIVIWHYITTNHPLNNNNEIKHKRRIQIIKKLLVSQETIVVLERVKQEEMATIPHQVTYYNFFYSKITILF